jgi:hypothetical protein
MGDRVTWQGGPQSPYPCGVTSRSKVKREAPAQAEVSPLPAPGPGAAGHLRQGALLLTDPIRSTGMLFVQMGTSTK